jgi:hypothetical protein
MLPQFQAAKKGVPALVISKKEEFLIGSDTFAATTSFPDSKWSLHLSCTFHDGNEKWDTQPLIVTSTAPNVYADGVGVKFAENHVYVFSEAQKEKSHRHI